MTISFHRALLWSLFSIVACATSQPPPPSANLAERTEPLKAASREGDFGPQVAIVTTSAAANAAAEKEGLGVRTFDLNHDGKPDIFRFFKMQDDPQSPGKQVEVLVRKEIDINQDGRIDLVRHYGPNQQVVQEQADLDFDGKIDEVSYYQEGVLARSELDLDFDGKPDIVKFYAAGQLIRIEADRNHRGKIDTWEYYELGKLDRVGMDTDGDGQVDTWERQSKLGLAASGPPPADPNATKHNH